MKWKTYKFKDFLKRSKIPIEIDDTKKYKRVTIRTKHQGVSVRDYEIGKKIGTKKQFVLKSGQFILSKIDARYGAFGIAPNEVNDAIITGNFWAYDVDFSIINIEWFNNFTNSQRFYDLCERASSGITHRKYLNEKIFLNYEIDLPEIENQDKILEAFKKREKVLLDQNQELTKQFNIISQLRQAFLREAMEGKLVSNKTSDNKTGQDLLEEIKAEKKRLIKEKKIRKPKPLPPITEDEIPYEIPENWVWCRLGDIVLEFLGGFAFKSARYIKNSTNQVIRLGNVKNDFLNFNANPVFISDDYSTEAARAELFPNDLLVTMTGTRAKRDYLYTLLLEEEHFKNLKLFLNQRVGCLRLFSNLNLNYILNLLKVEKILEPIFKSATGAANQANIGVAAIMGAIIPLPPLEIQNRIVQKLDDLMAYCDNLEQSVKESLETNEMLLQQVLREALEPEREVEKV